MPSQLIDLAAFEAAPMHTEPYKYMIVPHFVPAAALDEINASFPKITRAGSFPLASLRGGRVFNQLIDRLEEPELRRLMEEKFSIDLTGRPTLITVRGASRPKDGSIHTDSETKLLTVLIYLNREWTQEGGRLRLLRSRDINDYVAEIPPLDGTLLAFQRSEKSLHGHLPCEGIRRSVQLNWVRDASVVAGQARRHGLSAFIKSLLPARHVPD
jgi:hypothetical protein